MSIQMPETPEDMLRLPGVTKANFEKYGQKLLKITVKYSAEKFCIMSDHDDKIESFATQPPTSSARAKISSKKALPRSRLPSKASYASNDGWINTGDMDMESINSIKSRYTSKTTSTTRKKRVTRKKRKSRGSSKKRTPVKRKGTTTKPTSVLSSMRKSLSKANVFRYSPQSAFATASKSSKAKPGSSSTGGSGGGGLGGLGLMPMPKPAQRKLNL